MLLRHYPPARVQRPRWTSAKNSPVFPTEVGWGLYCVVDKGLPRQRCKDRGADLLHRVRVFAVELVDRSLGMREICCGLPRVLANAVSFPFDEVLELASEQAAVQNFFDNVFLLPIDFNRCWRGWGFTVDFVPSPGRESVYVEDIVDLERRGQFKPVVAIAELLDDGVGAELFWAELHLGKSPG